MCVVSRWFCGFGAGRNKTANNQKALGGLSGDGTGSNNVSKALGALGSRGPPCAPHFVAVLRGPGFPDRTSPFHSSRDGTAPQPCPSPGRPTRRPPGRAVAEWSGRVIRRGRAESGEEWWSQPRARFIARATQSWSPRERSERGGSRRRSRLVMPKISDFRAAQESLLSWWNERARAGGAFCAAPIRATEEQGYAAQNARADRGLSRCLRSRQSRFPKHHQPVPTLTLLIGTTESRDGDTSHRLRRSRHASNTVAVGVEDCENESRLVAAERRQ